MGTAELAPARKVIGGPDAAIQFSLKRLLALGYDFVGLIENDIQLKPGWLPAMLAASLAGPVVLRKFRLPMQRLIPLGLAAVAILLIWRGAMGPAHCHGGHAPGTPDACCARPGRH